jgi:putative transcriptional regulator
MITHHPPFEMIVDYATGALPAGVALVAATHAAMCRECRSVVEQLETLGGVILDDTVGTCDDNLLTSVLDKLDDPEVPNRATTLALDSAFKRLIPRPLRRYVTGNLDDLEWRSEAGLWKEARLPVRGGGLTVSLMRLRPGEVPKHGHYGNEYTLVLAGGYKDEGRQFWPGDFAIKHSADVHQPAIDSDECTCLVVLDAPLRLTGLGEGC